jgi:CBS domain containing-hemolysin-like protein
LGLEGNSLRVASYAIGLTVSTFVTMLVGELIPKNIALALPIQTARATQWFQRVFTAIMVLPIRILNGVANRTLLWMGIEPQEELRSARSPARTPVVGHAFCRRRRHR